MSETMQLPDGHPMIVAWKKYQATSDYKNVKIWAMTEEHVDGSLWAAFAEGWGQNQIKNAFDSADKIMKELEVETKEFEKGFINKPPRLNPNTGMVTELPQGAPVKYEKE
jgi:hypothetical protein